jgi:hypothetical protein
MSGFLGEYIKIKRERKEIKIIPMPIPKTAMDPASTIVLDVCGCC